MTEAEEIDAIAAIGRGVWRAVKDTGHDGHGGFSAGNGWLVCLCGETVQIPAEVTR